jgi:very-short-patch-repair endonuclease
MKNARKPAHRASSHMIARARELRNNATEEERLLWYRLRSLRKHGFRFRRQSPFDRYVLDFVCHERLVVVELDGSQHGTPENERSDAIRDAFLRGRGYRTIRIPNWWVKDDPDWVSHFIQQKLKGPIGGSSEIPKDLS